MPRPSEEYPVDPELLSGFLALSPWSQAEMAKRFGVGRANWVGLLHGRRTIGKARFMDLLQWVGLQITNDKPSRLPGLLVWRIASEQHVEAFRNLPAALQPEDSWDLVVSSPLPGREWIHALALGDGNFPVLLSVRPQWYPFLRTFRPGLFRHHKLWLFGKGISIEKIHASLGEDQPPVLLETKSKWFVSSGTEGLLAPDLEEWARWMRQTLHVDTSSWFLTGIQEENGEAVPGEDASGNPDVCRKVWAYLSHRLDLGDTHVSVCGIPVFLLEQPQDYPMGMVRLDVSFLDRETVQAGREQRLAFYRDESSGVLWLLQLRDPVGCAGGQPVSGCQNATRLPDREEVLGILAGAPDILGLGKVVGCFGSQEKRHKPAQGPEDRA